MLQHYIKQNLLAIDQLVNTLIGGYADETLSSRAYRASRRAGHWRWRVCARVINFLFRDPEHCFKAYKSERIGKQLPPEFRDIKKEAHHV